VLNVYAAEGKRGLQVYDAANVANKDYSQSIVAAGGMLVGGFHLSGEGAARRTVTALAS